MILGKYFELCRASVIIYPFCNPNNGSSYRSMYRVIDQILKERQNDNIFVATLCVFELVKRRDMYVLKAQDWHTSYTLN